MQTDVLCDAVVSSEPTVVKHPTEPSTCGEADGVPTADFVSTPATQTAPVVILTCDSAVALPVA